jgi:membrane protein DedA with SNARE-associated domain
MTGIEATLFHLIDQWYLTAGYFGIILAMALESCCIPLPSEIVMPLAGYFVLRYPDRFSLPGVALAGATGCLIGSAVAYGIGRAGGRPLLLKYGRYVLISQADSDTADRLFARHGGAVAFFSRLLPIVRTYISLPAGIARMGFIRFCAYTFVGSLIWSLGLAWIGTRIGENVQNLGGIFHGLDAVIAAVIVVVVVLYVRRHIKHDRAARAAAAAAADGSREGGGSGGMGGTSAHAPKAYMPIKPILGDARVMGPEGDVERRPRAIPMTPLDPEDRPTLPYMEATPAWPNRFARPSIERPEDFPTQVNPTIGPPRPAAALNGAGGGPRPRRNTTGNAGGAKRRRRR